MRIADLAGSRRGIRAGIVAMCVLFACGCGQHSETPVGGSNAPGTPIASSFQGDFKIANLNDGTAAAWGSNENPEDTYAGYEFPVARTVRTIRITAFSPDNRPHLRDISVVTADAASPKPVWKIVRARLQGAPGFATKLTVPAAADEAAIAIEVDPTDPGAGPHKVWGIACMSTSMGYIRNYLPVGNGVYLRELKME